MPFIAVASRGFGCCRVSAPLFFRFAGAARAKALSAQEGTHINLLLLLLLMLLAPIILLVLQT